MTVLATANQRWHQQLDQAYQAFLESLTALDLDQAARQWASFSHSLSQHIKFEQQHIEPLAKSWNANTLQLIQADHLILNRLLPRLENACGLIVKAHAQRAELVRQLNDFIKMRNVLEHHDLREMEHLYPHLEQQLDPAEARNLAEQMDSQRLKGASEAP